MLYRIFCFVSCRLFSLLLYGSLSFPFSNVFFFLSFSVSLLYFFGLSIFRFFSSSLVFFSSSLSFSFFWRLMYIIFCFFYVTAAVFLSSFLTCPCFLPFFSPHSDSVSSFFLPSTVASNSSAFYLLPS